MEIDVVTRKKDMHDLLKVSCMFFSNELKINNKNITLSVQTIPKLYSKTGMRGATFQLGKNDFDIGLDSRLDLETMLITLAHEMVHVKQYSLGQLKLNEQNNFVWLGKVHNNTYYESPWEIEAFKRERILANRVFNIILMRDNHEA